MKTKSFVLLLLLALSVLAVIRVDVASSQEDTIVYVNPALSYAGLGETFTVDVMVEDVEEMYSWQVKMAFNSSVLEFVDWVEGDFLAEMPEGTWNATLIEEDYALINVNSFGNYLGLSGSGWLMTMEFEVVGTGEFALNITNDWTKLIKFNPPPVPPGGEPTEPIPHAQENGFFTNTIIPPHAEFTISPELPGINQAITFNASASFANPPSEIIQYEWDFGDGTTATYVKDANLTTAATHAYSAAGTYTVSLTVLDDTPASALVQDLFGTTTMPRQWYDFYAYTFLDLLVRFSHDVAIQLVTAPSEATIGDVVDITVQVWNKGTDAESFNLAVYYDENEIEKRAVTLDAEATETLTFQWDTTDVAEGTYQISANATDVDGEVYFEDNYKIDGTIRLTAGASGIPTEWIIAIVVVVIVVAVGAFLYLRRRGGTPAT